MTFVPSPARLQFLQANICGHVAGPRSILDIGCGNGELLRRLALHYRARCTGLDTKTTPLTMENVQIIRADYQTWQCGDQFDLVIATGILHLLDMSNEALLTKLTEHVTPGGWLVYDLPLYNMSNCLNAALRRLCGWIRSPLSDRVITAIGQRMYGHMADRDFVQERLAYVYSPPTRYAAFQRGFGQRGFRLVASIAVPRVSIIELRAQRSIFRRV
jgi:SAM-dependent methyltransferase